MAKAKKQPAMAPYVYAFGAHTDGNAAMRETLGGKGANLAEMALIGLPVPPGFTLSTELCTAFYARDESFPKGLRPLWFVPLLMLRSSRVSALGSRKSPIVLCPLWCSRIHAGHDGYYFEPRPE